MSINDFVGRYFIVRFPLCHLKERILDDYQVLCGTIITIFSHKTKSFVASIKPDYAIFHTTKKTRQDEPFIRDFIKTLQHYEFIRGHVTYDSLYKALSYRVVFNRPLYDSLISVDNNHDLVETETFESLLTTLCICSKQ